MPLNSFRGGCHCLVGFAGPRGGVDAEEVKKNGVKFRMLDDDGEVYCYGYFFEKGEEGLSENAFSPLDDYGTPALGAAIIEYKENGEWAAL